MTTITSKHDRQVPNDDGPLLQPLVLRESAAYLRDDGAGVGQIPLATFMWHDTPVCGRGRAGRIGRLTDGDRVEDEAEVGVGRRGDDAIGLDDRGDRRIDEVIEASQVMLCYAHG